MAREIVIWCDVCFAQDMRTPAKEHSAGVSIGAPVPVASKSFALCEQHEAEILKPIADFLEEYGDPVEVPGAPAPKKSGAKRIAATGGGPVKTLIDFQQTGVRKGKPPAGPRGNECLWCPLTYSNDGGGFGRHLRVAHGFAGITEAYGGPCPVCGKGPYEQMLGHYKKSHPEMGFETVTQGYTWARDNGDPHGIYAAKLQQKGSLDPEAAHAEVRATEAIGEKARKRQDEDQLELPDAEPVKAPAKKAAAAKKPAKEKTSA